MTIAQSWNRAKCDVLLALHASRSAKSISSFRKQHPGHPLIVALTGTDLYREFEGKAAQQSVLAADHLIILQDQALKELAPVLRRKAHVIHQSVAPVHVRRAARPRQLRAVVVGHLRPLKDPFRPAMAVRSLPATSRIVIHHYGAALSARMETLALAEMKRNSRYRWFGERPRSQVQRDLANAWMLVHPSQVEGGANAVSEAIANCIPVLASRIPGSVGLLGPRYRGFFNVGGTRELRDLLCRCEEDARFYSKLTKQMQQRAAIVDPATERRRWQSLLANL